MKINKTKIIALCIICVIMSSLFVTVSADNTNLLIDNNSHSHDGYCFDDEGSYVEYTYTNMNADKAEQIVNKMNGYNDEKITPFGLFCLFGHSTQLGMITQTYHNYYSVAPRCREVYTDVEYCTRSDCDFFKVLSSSEVRMYCH